MTAKVLPTEDANDFLRAGECPLVSVVVLSHRSKLLPKALRSVFAQTEQDFQIVVQHCKKNWATKFNEAASIAIGEFIVPLCDDDLLAPEYLARCLERSDHADMIYTDRLCFTGNKKPETGILVRQLGDAFTLEKAGPKGYFTTQFPPDFFQVGATLPMTCMIRRTWWEQLGGYDPEMPHADTEFWYRSAKAKARFVYVPRPLFWYRMHKGQYHHTYASLMPAMRAFHKKHFKDFGMLFDLAEPADHSKTNWVVPVLIPEERDAYVAGVFAENQQLKEALKMVARAGGTPIMAMV